MSAGPMNAQEMGPMRGTARALAMMAIAKRSEAHELLSQADRLVAAAQQLESAARQIHQEPDR